ncbi:hypothetical protein D6827_03385 [Candidatus Parcubacteria bacterium]|nr:MAG: hypothetical protein D6827_03385 [Candidatus Parcubacteria bacterium]
MVDAEKITVDDIRKLLAKMSLKSASGNYKIIIIDNANRLNLSSQNVLLKTLEEPKGKAIIILVASGGETLLPTIISRCVKINFNLVPYKEMKQLPSADTAGGRPGLAYDMSNPDSMYRQWRQSAEDFLRMPLYQRLSFIDELVKEAKKNKEQKSEENDTIQGLILMWRILISDRLHNALRMNGKTRPPTAYTKALRALAETEIMLQENINKTLALQHFALSF